tara:strand:- start:2107 stop:2721 length:615 start_codon:yes stop_codon:yes gene_type:complete
VKFEDIINEIKAIDKVDIKGKAYTTVATRVEVFRKFFGFDYAINTELLVDDGKRILMKATITNKEGNVVGVGHAEEIRGSGYFPTGDKRNINTTSAVENCETSCIGRALSSLSLHGGEYASANEIRIAEDKKKKIEKTDDNQEQKIDWKAWVDQQKGLLDKMSKNGLVAWAAKEEANLVKISKENKQQHTVIFEYWKEKKNGST